MKIFRQSSDMQKYLQAFRNDGKSIGYVPTLGALHNGHASLIKKSHNNSDITVASIYVNPTQFNVKSDLDKYPKTYEADVELLKKNNCDVLYYPSTEEVYPDGMDKKPEIDLQGLDKVMEGAFRPGHFDGVVQVVKRLLELVQPDQLYMGQKDFQQFTLIQHMLDYFSIPTELVVCKIIREKNGLAMSSRNMRLSKKAKENAAIIYKTLQYVHRKFKKDSAEDCISYAMKRLSKGAFEPEYFSIVDGRTLQAVSQYSDSNYIVACTAVWIENVRLIDNKILKKD